MNALKQIRTEGMIPLMAALPYNITVEGSDNEPAFIYDPVRQLTVFARGHDYSTCREDESISPWFGKSRSDTKKDD